MHRLIISSPRQHRSLRPACKISLLFVGTRGSLIQLDPKNLIVGIAKEFQRVVSPILEQTLPRWGTPTRRDKDVRIHALHKLIAVFRQLFRSQARHPAVREQREASRFWKDKHFRRLRM